jgi:protein TonB
MPEPALPLSSSALAVPLVRQCPLRRVPPRTLLGWTLLASVACHVAGGVLLSGWLNQGQRPTLCPMVNLLQVRLVAANPAPAPQPTVTAAPRGKAPAPRPVAQAAAQPTRPALVRHVAATATPPAMPPTTVGAAQAGPTGPLPAGQWRTRVSPVYPLLARQRGEAGTVLIHAQVAPDGRPAAVRVAASSGYDLLDEAARRAVQQWTFQNQPGWVAVPVVFKLL